MSVDKLALENMNFNNDRKITLNVGGQKFKTRASTLSRIPGTRLSSLQEDDLDYDQDEKEFYFDRNPWLFPYVLDAYREGEVHFPSSVCGPAIQAELQFWGLKHDFISNCCWKACSEWDEEQKALDYIKDKCGSKDNCHLVSSQPEQAATNMGCRNTLWRTLDDARYSKLAMAWAICYLIMLIVSILVHILSTCPSLEGEVALDYINLVCSVFFMIELIVRFITCPTKCRFFYSIYNIIDVLHILAIIVLFISLIVSLLTHNMASIRALLVTITIIRVIRTSKIFGLCSKFQVIYLAIRASMKELLLQICVYIIFIVVFSVAAYSAEQSVIDGSFVSVSDGLWWSIVTLTTVGYGDIIPVSSAGKVIAAVCSLCGIFMTAVSIAIITTKVIRFSAFMSIKTRLDRRVLLERSYQKI